MKIRGIPIRFHWAWFVAIVLITLSLGTTLFPARSPEMSPVATWASSFATALLIYLSVLLHELAHAIEAQQAGMYVRKITMHFFGGLADIGSEFWLWKTELKVAAAGPLLSLILFVILYSFHNVSVMCLYLATINLILIGFNIVPVFPLDGGRILRSLLWRYYGDMLKATEVSVIIAARLTYFIIFMGILLLFRQNYSWGVWLLILSFYLLTVNRGIFRQIEGVRDVDEHYSIRDLMVPMKDVVTLDYEREERMTVSEFCRKIHVPHGFVVYPVCGADL